MLKKNVIMQVLLALIFRFGHENRHSAEADTHTYKFAAPARKMSL